jgi:cell division septal protein FtsQ
MSLFKRKPRNRRLGRDTVLDVKLRSSKAREVRLRAAGLAAGGIFGSILACFLLYHAGAWALDELVYENRTFAIRDVEIETDGVIPVDQLRRWSGVKPGQNLLSPNLLADVKRRLEMEPLIQRTSIERILPHTLRIHVTEREPLAQVNVPRPVPGGGIEIVVFQLDSEGWVMLPLQLRQVPGAQAGLSEELPVVSGISSSEMQAGRRIDTPQVQAALQLLLALERSPLAGNVDIKRIDVSTADTLSVSTAQGSEVVLGLADFDQQLRRWQAVLDSGRKLGKAIGKLDLAITNNIPVCWLEGPVPVVAPKPPKTPHTKRKHV